MRLARLAPIVALFVAGCGGGGPDETASKLPGSSTAGKRILVQNNCLACHQLGGEGNGAPGGDLTTIGAESNAAAIRKALVDPPPGMSAYTRVSAADREALVAYLAGLR